MTMTHRERLITALDHREPDRVPIDLGGSRSTGMVLPAYDRLREHLGFGEPGAIHDRMQQVVVMDEQVMEHLDVDVRGFAYGERDVPLAANLGDDRYRDDWGIVRWKPSSSPYFDLEVSPLAGEVSVADVARYDWPDPTDPGLSRGLREQARRLHEETDYGVMFNARFSIVQHAQYLRGFMDFYLDLGANHAMFHAVMTAITDVMVEVNRRTLAEVGEFVDVVSWADDVGGQDRTMCSPADYRAHIKPYHARAMATIREYAPQARTYYHSCGSVYELVEEFIDLGITALNPIQVTATNMEPERLKGDFGDRIAFWGALDSQRILPFGSADDVRGEVRRLFEILGEDGGWVLAAVHNIQPDVPPENVLALVDEGRRCRYGDA